jgi:lysosomal acid lipase/cholesteryl ester hydrolase
LVYLKKIKIGASVNQLTHYGQLINSGKFRMFDYGYFENKRVYGQSAPPDYELSKITAPVFLHYSGNDWLSAPKVSLIKFIEFLISKKFFDRTLMS